MFCLEPVKSTEMAFNPIGCPCLYKSHGNCLHAWFEEKQQYECPICHTLSIPNPAQQQIVRIVYIQNPEIPHNNPLVARPYRRCVGISCMILFLTILILTLIDIISRIK